MKNYVIKMVALLVFASVAISSCSLEYRQRHGRTHDQNQPHDHDRNNNDHHLDEIHHY